MKPAFFIIVIALAAYGCKRCGTCTTTTITTVSVPAPGYPQTTTASFEACGDERDAWDGSVSTNTESAGGITATSTASTECD